MKRKIMTNLQNMLQISEKEGTKTVRWIFKQNMEYQKKFFTLQKTEYFKLLKKFPTMQDNCIIASFYNIAAKLYNEDSVTKDIKTFECTKESKKTAFLLNHVAVVRELQSANFSTRKMALFFQHKFRVSISHTYIANFIKSKEI